MSEIEQILNSGASARDELQFRGQDTQLDLYTVPRSPSSCTVPIKNNWASDAGGPISECSWL